MLFISIPTPCHEKWNEMSPSEQGAFCNVCSKTVVDFTSLSDEQVQNYFLKQREQRTCGRFRNDQLSDKEDPLKKLLSDAVPFWKKFLAIVLVVFGSFLTGCNNNVQGNIAVRPIEYTQKVVKLTTPGELGDFVQKIDTLVEVQCTQTVGITMIEPVEIIEMPVDIAMGPCEMIIVREIKTLPVKDENGNEKKDNKD
jgi:hypothetical protein